MQQLFKSASWNRQQVDCVLSRRMIPISNLFLNKGVSTGKERLQCHQTYFQTPPPEATENVWSQKKK